MDLHRHDGVPDWEKVDPSVWNRWQKRAHQTNGWDTPGNRESALGLIESTLGIALIAKKHYIFGVSVLAKGRIRDLRDGHKADITGTKSPKGEAIDAFVDKILMAEALPVFAHLGMISTQEAAAIGVQNAANAVLTTIAKARGLQPHSTKSGKYSTYGYWLGFGAKTFGRIAEHLGKNETAEIFNSVGSLILKASVAVGLNASRELTTVAFATHHHQDTLVPAA